MRFEIVHPAGAAGCLGGKSPLVRTQSRSAGLAALVSFRLLYSAPADVDSAAASEDFRNDLYQS